MISSLIVPGLLALVVVSNGALVLSLRDIAVANRQRLGAASERSKGFLEAILAVLAILVLWLVFFRFSYWIAHGPTTPAQSPVEGVEQFFSQKIDYALLDYVLLFGSLVVAVWPVFQFLNPPRDVPDSTARTPVATRHNSGDRTQ